MVNEIFPENTNFEFSNNKNDIHIAPVYTDHNISYRISYRCQICRRENVISIQHEYSFVPQFADILNSVNTPCSCKKYIFTQAFHGVSYHLYTDTTMRYSLPYKSKIYSQVSLNYKEQVAIVYDPRSKIKPKALEILNSCAIIQYSLSQWINAFKALDNELLQPESKMPQKIMPEVYAANGDVYKIKFKSICGHHFFIVTDIKPTVVDVECIECGHKKYVPKDNFIENYRYYFHSNIYINHKNSNNEKTISQKKRIIHLLLPYQKRHFLLLM